MKNLYEVAAFEDTDYHSYNYPMSDLQLAAIAACESGEDYSVDESMLDGLDPGFYAPTPAESGD